jgi:hypothetical protein
MLNASWKIRKQVLCAMRKCRTRTLFEKYGISFNTEEMASAKSFVRGLSHLGSSYREFLPSTKRLHHFFTIKKISTFASWTNLSLAVIAEARRPLNLRKRMSARCSRNILNVQTRTSVLKKVPGWT